MGILQIVNNVNVNNYKEVKSTLKLNKSEIMRNAWIRVKEKGYSLSYALECAWYDAKYFFTRILEKIAEIERNIKLNETSSEWKPDADTMYQFYNSNVYKGD